MNGSTGPPSDVTAMGSENDEGGSKVRRGPEDSATSASSPSSSGAAAPYPTLQAADQPEYRGQGSIRADSASPLPTTSSSSSSSSLSSSSSPPPSPLPPPPPPPPGCGCVAATVLEPDEITISITPTTGGQFDLTVDRTDTVENLKKIISKRLKVTKERICLLHRERQLREGTLEENRLQDGSRLTLLPSVETGLLAQRPEQSVMQALESLNDSQVNDFLSGKAPLNLTMRFGHHVMLIQLQLSTVTHVLPTAGLLPNASGLPTSHVSSSLQSRRSTVPAARTAASASSKLQNDSAAARTSSLLSSLASALCAAVSRSTRQSTTTTTMMSPVCSSRATTASSVSSTSYSPISPPHSSFCTSQSQSSSRTSNHGSASPTNKSSACQSCRLHHYHPQHHSRYHHHHHSRYHHHHRHHHLHHSRNKPTSLWTTSSQSSSTADHLQQSTSTGHSCSDSMPYDATPPRKKLCIAHHHNQQSTSGTDSTSSRSTAVDGDAGPQSPTSSLADQSSKTANFDTRALAEATRNLTQKLKQLSSEENARRRHGAIIESMHHHGKGVYSGTFSGTLNPALQDPHGRPKRDISTIVHILNDLICATPATNGHYSYECTFGNDRQQSSTSTSSTGTTTTSNGASTPSGCRDSSTSGYSTEELSKENEATKGKMRRLRLVMEQRRAKRKARRQARAAPYTTQWAAVTPDPDPNHDPNTSTASSSAAATNTAEPQNEPELQPCSPEPVVA